MSCDKDNNNEPTDTLGGNYLLVDDIEPITEIAPFIEFLFEAQKEGVSYGYGHTLKFYAGQFLNSPGSVTGALETDAAMLLFYIYTDEKNDVPSGTYRIC